MLTSKVGSSSGSTLELLVEGRRAGEADGVAASDEACDEVTPFPFFPLPFFPPCSTESSLPTPDENASSLPPPLEAGEPFPSRRGPAEPGFAPGLPIATGGSSLALEVEAMAPVATVEILLNPLTMAAEVVATQAELRLRSRPAAVRVLDLLRAGAPLAGLVVRSAGESRCVASCCAMIFLMTVSRRLPLLDELAARR